LVWEDKKLSAQQNKKKAIHSSKAKHLWQMLFLSWLVALASTLGVLFIGEIMGREPCVLCWYQRAFMFPLAVVLGAACYLSDSGVWRYALPLAAFGGVIAAYHTLLVAGVIPQPLVPCGKGVSCTSEDMMIFSVVPIPLLSVAAFGAIILLLLLVRKRTEP
jgi:disulfide bond formation protein DsbB